MTSLPTAADVSLASWRTLGPNAFRAGMASQMITLLLDKTAFADEDGRRQLTAAATQKVGAMVAVADRLGREGGDLSYSWLTLAALQGDRAATAQVAAELARRARAERFCGRRRESRRLACLAAEWAEGLVGDLAPAFGDDRRRLLEGWLHTTPPSAAAPPASPDASPAEPGALVVLPQGIPPLKNGADDRALVEAWKILTRPLPLVEGLPADLLATVLELEFPWMAEAVAAIADELRLRQTLGLAGFRLRPLLLSGPPGTGKTSFARRVAELSGIGFGELSARRLVRQPPAGRHGAGVGQRPARLRAAGDPPHPDRQSADPRRRDRQDPSRWPQRRHPPDPAGPDRGDDGAGLARRVPVHPRRPQPRQLDPDRQRSPPAQGAAADPAAGGGGAHPRTGASRRHPRRDPP